MKTSKTFNRYIPILVKEKLDTLNYYRTENLYCIVDLIYRNNIHYKNEAQKTYGFAPIAQAAFREIISSSNEVSKDMDYLIDNGIVERNDYYSADAKIPKSYRLNEKYLSDKVTVQITSSRINNRIGKQIERMKRARVKNLQFQKSIYYKTCKINHVAAKEFLLNNAINELKELAQNINYNVSDEQIKDLINCTGDYKVIRNKMVKSGGDKYYSIIHRLMNYTTQINCINDGYLYFKRNKTNNRLNTNLTSLPSMLRKFIVSEQDLYNIDLKNSQPYFLYTLIHDESSINKEELIKYRDLVVSGITGGYGLYEFLEDEYEKTFNKPLLRPQIKQITFEVFYSQNKSYRKHKDFFSKYFPSINRWIEKQKEFKHNAFAIKLQAIESHIVLDVILSKLKEKNVIPFTIHDSFICNEDEKDIVFNEIVAVNRVLYGVNPNIHVECISKIKDYHEGLIVDEPEFIIEQ